MRRIGIVFLFTLADLPDRYERDVLAVIPQAPHTLFVTWEVSSDTLARLATGRAAAELQLVTEDVQTGERRSRHAEAQGWCLVGDLEPGHEYRTRLESPSAEVAPTQLLEHAPVSLPADIWPDSL